MGWGARTTPQPKNVLVAGDLVVPDPAVDPNRKAMVESIGLMANKGWLAERKLMVIHDFFMARGLYADFNNFIRRMR